MNETHKNQLEEIKLLMERSSKFISLSGLSGVSAGIIALIGLLAGFFYLEYDLRYFDPESFFGNRSIILPVNKIFVLLLIAAFVLILALISAFFFTLRKAKKEKQKVWNSVSKRMFVNLAIPLAAGGVFCLLLLTYGLIFLIAPATLIFYGLALINAGKYTLSEVRWLGVSELLLGLLATAFAGYGIIAWGIGFGILHIIYGIAMYFRYEHNKK